jgi:hypothetical protein
MLLEEANVALDNLEVCKDDIEELGRGMDDCCELDVIILDANFRAFVADVE